MVNLAYDFTGDGWPDVLSMSGNAGNGIGNLYVNPKNESRLWPHYITIPPVGNEETLFKDINGDGRPDLIHAGMNTLRFSTFDPAKWDANNPTAMWTTTTVSEPGPWGVNIGHGLGVGDINGDGRSDFLNAYGWWEQPVKGTTGLWTHHPTPFGRWGERRKAALAVRRSARSTSTATACSMPTARWRATASVSPGGSRSAMRPRRSRSSSTSSWTTS